jgi:hypothetical protein
MPANVARLNNARTPEQWADDIRGKWQDQVASIFEVARMLETAYKELDQEGWLKLIREELKWSKSMVSKLIAIAEDEHGSFVEVSYRKLPASWTILYALAKLTPEQFQAGLDSGVIHAGMGQKDVAKLKPKRESRPKNPTPQIPSPQELQQSEEPDEELDPNKEYERVTRQELTLLIQPIASSLRKITPKQALEVISLLKYNLKHFESEARQRMEAQ